MSNFLKLLLISLFAIKCNSLSKKNDVLSEKEFKIIIKEMVEAETFVIGYVIKDSTKNQKAETLKLYEKIFVLHKTTKNIINNSLAYYLQKPEKFKVMLDSIQLVSRKLDISIPTNVKPL